MDYVQIRKSIRHLLWYILIRMETEIFSFYRNPGADMKLNKEEICEDIIKETKIFHFGTLSMTHEEVREATKEAIRIAEESGAIISFDPNLRPPLWNSLDEAKERCYTVSDIARFLKFLTMRFSG